MNKIFKFTWYNEDSYGPTEEVSVTSQSDTEDKAKQIAVDFILENYPTLDFNYYKNFEAIDITDRTVLASFIGNFA